MHQNEAVAFPYGRTGLIAILKSLGLKNKEIICPAYTCVVVAHAIVKSGNIPVFVDSQEYDFNMDLSLASAKINKNTGAIIATSIFGYPVNLDQLKELKNKNPGLHIIQDCAHSFGARWNGELVNTFGVASFYGLNISKIITTVFGGVVLTDDPDLARKLKKFRENNLFRESFKRNVWQRIYLILVFFAFRDTFYGIVNYLDRKGVLSSLSSYYEEDVIDLPNDYLDRMTPVGASVGIKQLERYDEIITKRVKVAQLYFDGLQGVPGLELPPIVDGATYSHFVLRIDEGRDGLLSFALERGLQLGWLIEYSIPLMSAYRKFCESFSFPISEKMSRNTVNLPLNVKDPRYVVKVIREYFGASC